MRWSNDTVAPIRRSVADYGGAHQIRSYVLQPYTMVKDLRTGLVRQDVQAILNGAIDDFLREGLLMSAQRRENARNRKTPPARPE